MDGSASAVGATRVAIDGRVSRLTSLLRVTAVALSLALSGCASDDYGGSSSTVHVGASFYYGAGFYGSPYYWYDNPDYIVVPPDRVDRPNNPGAGGGGVRPEQPIAKPPATGPSQLPAAPSASSRSRMPSAQPRMSSPSTRMSVPRGSRGGMRR